MPSFSFRAAAADGRTISGVEEAVSSVAVERALAQRGLFALEIGSASSAHEEKRSGAFVSRRADVSEAVANLASLLEAGLPLSRALEVTARGAARNDVVAAFEFSNQRVQEGGVLADAWAEYPHVFSPVSIGLVRAADRGGHLTAVLRRLAGHLEREQKLRARVFSALMYPLFLVTAGAIALVVLLVFVLPRFVALLDEAGTSLPPTTALLLSVSSVLSRIWPVLILGIVVTGLGFLHWRQTEEGRLKIDRFWLRVPMVGPLRARQAVIRLSRTLETLLAGGLPLAPALNIAGDAVGDSAIREDVLAAESAIRRGDSLSAAIKRGRAFPHAFIRLIEVGEETGQMDQMLGRSAALMEDELERRLDRLVTLIEPALIIVFAVVIGFVALSLMQAIYGVNADAF